MSSVVLGSISAQGIALAQEELRQIHQEGLPSYLSRLDLRFSTGPVEWLWEPTTNGCASGNCGNAAGGQAQQQSTGEESCHYVDGEITFADDTAYCMPPDDPIRIRIIVPPSFGGGNTWPLLHVLSPIHHMAVEHASGSVQAYLFELGAEHLEAPSGDPSTLGRFVSDGRSGRSGPSILNVLRIFRLCLRDSPPVELFGESTEEGGPGAHWRHAASQHRMMRGVIELYRSSHCAHPALLLGYAAQTPVAQPAAASQDDYAFWRPSTAWPDGILEPAFIEALAALRRDGEEGAAVLRAYLREEISGMVFSMPFFTASFCEALVEEFESFEASGLPAARPNSMNNYGTIVNNIGMEGFMTRLQNDVSRPLGAFLFPGKGYEWLYSHHSFSVRYTAGEDLGLDMHTDDSDVTLNVCLGKPGFTAAGLTFCGLMGAADHRRFQMNYRHQIGRAIVHLGQQRHGADDIAEGTRVNLIMWNKSTVSRRRKEHNAPGYEIESGPPSLQCLSYTHDRDYKEYKAVPPGKENFAKRGWCPPPGREHTQHST